MWHEEMTSSIVQYDVGNLVPHARFMLVNITVPHYYCPKLYVVY